ncbi:Pentatricopeptide repeat [Kalmanozyma brasiliensis GHG001]|uniref:Pentacotripeptide-repeat region of PRORP domain-containing protein n=1 Tax=Kalmanozyma brasiliensis (strain GHG001) TaxID=1365824 RepID=V5ENN9_KALBG|nr:Pentatricopeptide repeat [Kalmanozyma brasiliensis GHG001]EST06710.1 Pentatricopeptide repeat [Kalmanozyma brasiliensis GHG001]
MDFNRYSPPLRRQFLPEDAPALYEDEIKASAAWLPESSWNLDVPDDYPLRHELFLILDSLDDISQCGSDPDYAEHLAETLRQARELIWANPQRPLRKHQDTEVALYLAGKAAETYVKLDVEDSLARLLTFLDYVQTNIGVLPLQCFHALAAHAGIARRYDAVLKICQVARSYHNGQTDAELLHLTLRALIAQSKDADVTRYWDSFDAASLPVPRKTFDLLLRTHVRRQDVEQVNDVLRTMPQHGHKVDAKAWLTILRGFQSFRPTLAAMLKRDAKIVQSPTLNVVNHLLLLLSRELDVDGVLMVLRIFRIPTRLTSDDAGDAAKQDDDPSIIDGPSPRPNVQTYVALTQMFGRLGRPAEALPFFRLAVSLASNNGDDHPASIRLLQQASAHVMSAYLNAGHPVLAMSFATEALGLPHFGSAETKQSPSSDFHIPSSPRIPIAPYTSHYRILLECASAIGSPESARRIVVHLLRHGHPTDAHVLRGLARLIFTTIDQDALESIHVLRRLLPGERDWKARHTARDRRLGSLSDLLHQLGVPERVVLASQQSTDLHRDAPGVGSKLMAKSSPGESSKDELRDWLIRDASPFGPADAGTDTPALAQDLRQPLTPEAYAMRIRVYAVVRRDYLSAQRVYHAMLTHGVKPTMMHIAPLIEGLTAVGKLDEAQRLKANAVEVTGLQPTLRIHTALIRAYVRAGNTKAARNEVKELTENGFRVDDTVANIIEAAQSGRRNFSLVDRPVDDKDAHGVATRFHSLMAMRRYLAAQETVQTALDAGLKPDKVLQDLVRRSTGYVQKQLIKAQAGGEGSHMFELAQAARLAGANRDRVTRSVQRMADARRSVMKERRKKVVSLVMDFAEGRLHELAGVASEVKGKEKGGKTEKVAVTG